MEEQIKFYEELEQRYNDAREQLFSIKRALDSYDEMMKQYDQQINENLAIQNITNDERKRAILLDSFDKLAVKYEKFRTRRNNTELEYKNICNYKIQTESDLNSMKTQIANLKKLQDNTHNSTDRLESVYDYDVETINFLNEGNWNLGISCDRTLAESLLGCFPSGTFLVRASKTKQDSFALSVVANSKVQHCLIDKINDGYCFHPPGPQHSTYPSLCSLVMDYRHKSLLKHHPQLNTSLIYPVLSQIRKNQPNDNLGRDVYP